MDIDSPDVVAEVKSAFERYERAINANDVATLNELFWNSPRTVRYGTGEQLYGHEAIAGFRAARNASDVKRELLRVAITAFGRDLATASCEYRRLGSGREGRQMQTWVRFAEGWRIVAAHVSFKD
jgi:ketosteroid isomerase-like protein